MKKALIPQFSMADDAALRLALDVIKGLSGNPDFPTPPVPLASVQTAYDAYAASLSKSRKGSAGDKLQKNADKATLIGMLRSEADYVNFVAAGDLQKLTPTGFPLSKTPEPSVLGTAAPSVEYGGNSGEVFCSTPKVEGAATYKHQYAPDGQNAWSEVATTKTRCKIVNLTPGVVYAYRIVSIGTSDQVTVSEVITKMAV